MADKDTKAMEGFLKNLRKEKNALKKKYPGAEGEAMIRELFVKAAPKPKAKEKLYDKLSASDKKGEKGQLLQNALKDIKKKLKGQVPIRTLESAKLLNKGGLSTKDYGKAGGYNMGGLATPTPKQTGLKKLPTGVRNKMGYMYGGGMANKKMGSTDYRKGGLVIMITGGKPMKNKKGTK